MLILLHPISTVNSQAFDPLPSSLRISSLIWCSMLVYVLLGHQSCSYHPQSTPLGSFLALERSHNNIRSLCGSIYYLLRELCRKFVFILHHLPTIPTFLALIFYLNICLGSCSAFWNNEYCVISLNTANYHNRSMCEPQFSLFEIDFAIVTSMNDFDRPNYV